MYTIKVTRDQYDFIRTALNKFHQDFMTNLDQQITPFPPPEAESVTITLNEVLATKKPAKYGYKLDGTPKKRPGRKAKK